MRNDILQLRHSFPLFLYLLASTSIDFLLPSFWGTNDDIGFQLISEGKIFSNYPSPLLRHISVFWGFGLIFLNQISSEYNWHGILSHSVLHFANISLIVALACLVKNTRQMILILAISLVFFLTFIVQLQFTTTAFYVSAVGFFILTLNSRSVEFSRPIFILAIVNIVIGTMLRWESAVLALFFLLFSTFSFSQISFVHRLQKVKSEITFVILLMISLVVIDKGFYKGNGWDNYVIDNKIKGNLMDYGGLDEFFKSDSQKELSISKIDLLMAQQWIFDGTIEKNFKEMDKYLSEKGVIYLGMQRFKKNIMGIDWKNSLCVGGLLFVALLFILNKNRKELFFYYLFSLALLCFLLMLFKFPQRVMVSFFCGLLLFSTFNLQMRTKGSCRVLFSILAAMFFFSSQKLYSHAAAVDRGRESLEKDVKLMSLISKDYLVFVWANSFPYEYLSTVRSTKIYFPRQTIFAFGGGHSLTPYYHSMKRKWGVGTPHLDLVEMEGAHLVGTEDRKNLLEKYYIEKKGQSILCTLTLPKIKSFMLWSCKRT